ncbi:MAG TPA: AbrB/MazE/SpoVT family DNA-binding domain-containing protein [Cerasibacillus sp.]|uniref:AbrB/MazE/SpoVT family DNA-binding domain-containing protein n=1 Tax=Cerasibacillus sp. TaxID=2498711 RepID=UPI002F425E42
MKSIGVVRKVDELGRIVIPIDIRRSLGINVKDQVEIYLDGDHIVLKKYQPEMACHVTGKVSDRNISIAGGNLVLSPEGAELLIKEIQTSFAKKDAQK